MGERTWRMCGIGSDGSEEASSWRLDPQPHPYLLLFSLPRPSCDGYPRNRTPGRARSVTLLPSRGLLWLTRLHFPSAVLAASHPTPRIRACLASCQNSSPTTPRQHRRPNRHLVCDLFVSALRQEAPTPELADVRCSFVQSCSTDGRTRSFRRLPSRTSMPPSSERPLTSQPSIDGSPDLVLPHPDSH